MVYRNFHFYKEFNLNLFADIENFTKEIVNCQYFSLTGNVNFLILVNHNNCN